MVKIMTKSSNTPDFIIVGTMKGGTTVLYDFICEHPDVSAATQKEIHYFSLNYMEGADWYHQHFSPKQPGKIIGEASPTYFDMAVNPTIPKAIKNDYPDVKIILIVRDPVERAISHYNHFCKINQISQLQQIGPERFFNLPYSNAIKATSSLDLSLFHVLNFSCYSNKYSIYESVFKDQLLVLSNEELLKTPNQTMEKVHQHLFLESYQSEIYNSVRYSAGTTRDQLSVETQKKLEDFLYPDYQKFCSKADIPQAG